VSSWDQVFVGADELAALIGGPTPPVLLDVRFDPRTGALPDEYAEGQLPGAVFVDLPRELADDPAIGGGRFPLPAIGALQESARRWGIRSHSEIVVYDDRSGISAARAAWVLRWAGLTRVRVLDGGLRAWRAARHPVSTGIGAPIPGDVELVAGALTAIDADAAARFGASGALVDARPTAAFAKGHVPGAVGVPADAALHEHGQLRPPTEVRRVLTDAGVPLGRPLAVYCGAGVSAAYAALVLIGLGEDVSVFIGSWSEWSADSTRPVATA
jgi:thiosulfate/3-mercaptopyruvate sulfurtransferase